MAKPVKDAFSVMITNANSKEVEEKKQARYRPAGEEQVRQSWQCRQEHLCHSGHWREREKTKNSTARQREREREGNLSPSVDFFQVSSPETATRTGGGGVLLGEPCYTYSTASKSRPRCLGFLQCWVIKKNQKKKSLQHRTPKNTLQGRRFADGQKQREERGVDGACSHREVPLHCHRGSKLFSDGSERVTQILTIINQLVYAADVLHQTFESMPGWWSCRRNQFLTNVRKNTSKLEMIWDRKTVV